MLELTLSMGTYCCAVPKPAMMRSGGPKVGSPFPTAVQDQDLVSQQHGFGYNGTEPTGSTKPDDDHDGMQQKGENVAHAQDGIRPKKLKIQALAEFATHTHIYRLPFNWKGALPSDASCLFVCYLS